MADEPGLTPVTTEAEAAAAPDAAAATLLTESSTPAEPAVADAVEAEGADLTKEGGDAVESGKTVPESYADFVMPEGVEIDGGLLEGAVPVFKELGLTQEQAQKLVDFQAAQVEAGGRKQAEAFSQLKDDWAKQSSTDKEFGGDKFEKSIGLAHAAVAKFGTPELKELMEQYGFGNHPEMVRFMVRVGKLTAPDVPGSTGAQTAAKVDRVSSLYPNG